VNKLVFFLGKSEGFYFKHRKAYLIREPFVPTEVAR